MFESAELEHRVDKETYEKTLPELREALLNAQFDLIEFRTFPVLILVSGFDGAGKAEAVNDLNALLDIHQVTTHAVGPATEEERLRPRMWRFWRALPPKGSIGIFSGSWYSEPLRTRILGHINNAELGEALDEINRFEKMLADEGALILKFWFHLSREQQKTRLQKLKKDPTRHWRLADKVLDKVKNYDKALAVAAQLTRHTSTGYAPWVVVGGTDKRYRTLILVRTILGAIRKRLAEGHYGEMPSAAVLAPPLDNQNVLENLDLGLKLERKDYKDQLRHYQSRLHHLSSRKAFQRQAVVLVFEGNDAAGKGGAIRRVAEGLDATQFRVIPVGAPTEEELAQPYLWRFWRRIPRLGQMTLFDRSWYGRVLVERVEGLCREADWMRAYSEINEFEMELTENRVQVIKFWLAIDADEQLDRFRAREAAGYKRYKLTEEDWRNRAKWDEYTKAACDMFDRTSTEYAPWTLVEANDKRYARIKVLKTLCDRIEAAL